MKKLVILSNFLTILAVCAFLMWPFMAQSLGGDPLVLFGADSDTRMPLVRWLRIAVWLYPVAVLLGLLGCYLVRVASGKSWIGWILVLLPMLNVIYGFVMIYGAGSAY